MSNQDEPKQIKINPEEIKRLLAIIYDYRKKTTLVLLKKFIQMNLKNSRNIKNKGMKGDSMILKLGI